MSNMTNDKKLRIALTLMQAMCVIALLIGTAAALTLGYIGVLGFTAGIKGSVQITAAALFGLATVAIVSVCSYIAIFRYLGMTRRLKKERAFTEQNGKALASIGTLCISCAAVLVLGYIGCFLCAGMLDVAAQGWGMLLLALVMNSVPFDVLAFMYLGVGLVSRALCGLLHRAKALQDENDLTV